MSLLARIVEIFLLSLIMRQPSKHASTILLSLLCSTIAKPPTRSGSGRIIEHPTHRRLSTMLQQNAQREAVEGSE
jgi:hypothetical protein